MKFDLLSRVHPVVSLQALLQGYPSISHDDIMTNKPDTIWLMIKRYYQTRFLVRKLYFYIEERGTTSVKASEFFDESYPDKEVRMEKYRFLMTLGKKTVPYVEISWAGTSYGAGPDFFVTLTEEGKDVYTWSAIIFGNMDVFIGIMLAVLGSLITILSHPVWDWIKSVTDL